MYHQRRLQPNGKSLGVLIPVPALVVEAHVEIEDDFSQDQAHLSICKTKISKYWVSGYGNLSSWVSENLGDLLLPDAVPRTGAERLHRIQSIASEPRVPREPLGVEAHRVGPKLRRVINRPLPDSDDRVFWYEVTRD